MPRRSRVHQRPRGARFLGAALLAGLLGTATPAAAAANCGTISFSFEGTRLINDGISHQAGPYAITLPAGTYDVVLRSGDTHSEQAEQIDQEAERWWFSLDSGWQSVASDDLPDELDTNMTVLRAQEVPASTAITLHHLGQGGVNSINPLCVGFTAVDEDPDTPGDPGDGPGDPGDPGDGPGDDPDRAIPDPDDPDDGPDRAIPDPGDGPDPGDPDNTPGDDPDRAIPDPGDPDDDPDRAIPDPGDPNDTPDPDDPNNTPGDPDDDPDRAIPDPGDPNDNPDPGDNPNRVPTDPVVPELAITGAGNGTIRLVGLAVILFQVGFLFQVADRHRRRA